MTVNGKARLSAVGFQCQGEYSANDTTRTSG